MLGRSGGIASVLLVVRLHEFGCTPVYALLCRCACCFAAFAAVACRAVHPTLMRRISLPVHRCFTSGCSNADTLKRLQETEKALKDAQQVGGGCSDVKGVCLAEGWAHVPS